MLRSRKVNVSVLAGEFQGGEIDRLGDAAQPLLS
jgi:hypothetical protein